MFKRSSGGRTIIFKDEDMAKPLIPPQIDHSLPVSPEDLLHTLQWESGQGFGMLRRLDHDFMGSDSIHLIIDPFALPVQLPFNAESGELIRDNAQ
jgi:hypothetical protein